MRRNRIAAKRDGVDAAPMRLLRSAPESGEGRLLARCGELPDSIEGALALINARPSPRIGPLTADDVYIHYIEAANDTFVPDRFLFLDRTTLRNIAEAASSGFAFMNSHRTGGISSPSELPFGRTFAGSYEEIAEEGDAVYCRVVVGLYMLRGIRPNGAHGPSTDELHASILGGTLSDVSMGLAGGMRICDLCGCELGARDPMSGSFACPHAPGTLRAMTFEQISAQRARSVSGGRASYTLVDAIPREVSAVYQGAVPGAGFLKTLALAREATFGPKDLDDARLAYAPLLMRGDLPEPTVLACSATEDRRPATPATGNPMDILRLFRFWRAAGEPDEIDLSAVVSKESPALVEPGRSGVGATDMDELSALRAQIASLEASNLQAQVSAIRTAADAFAGGEILASRILPAEREAIVDLYVQLAIDDRNHPIGDSPPGSNGARGRLEQFKSVVSSRPPHKLTEERIASDVQGGRLSGGLRALSHTVDSPTSNDPLGRDRLIRLLRQTPEGQAALLALQATE